MEAKIGHSIDAHQAICVKALSYRLINPSERVSTLQLRIYLVGFMGSGKSHVGRRLAEKLNIPFIDLDQRIVSGNRMSISEIFAKYGETHFRALERQALLDTCYYPPAIIATGGGAPCFFDNMQWMNEHGLSIFLDATEEVLFERLIGSKGQRPLLQQKTKKELRQFIIAKLAERRSFYEQAAVHIDIKEVEVDIASRLRQDLPQIIGH